MSQHLSSGDVSPQAVDSDNKHKLSHQHEPLVSVTAAVILQWVSSQSPNKEFHILKIKEL